MIITQTRQQRTFVGSINTGTDFVEGLKNICVDNTILCGVFSAVGYLKDPSLRTFDVAEKRYRDPESKKGAFHAISLQGNISLIERQTEVRCHAIGMLEVGDKRQMHNGELLGGEVISVEFHLTALDDIRLYRAEDARTGLHPWLHVEFGSSPHAHASGAAAEVSAAVSRNARAAESKSVANDEPEDELFEINPGDFINHPTLGRCEVVSSDGDERLTIRLASGRDVELHLGLLELTPLRREGDAQVYKVAIKRRR